MIESDIPALDWQGQSINCDACAHRDRLALGTCAPLRSCVNDRYAKRIDRFFGTNPGLASQYIDHPYFEVRAVAAKYLDLFQLNRLIHDPDETVRASVALRLPTKMLGKLIHDPDREVRVRVAPPGLLRFRQALPGSLDVTFAGAEANVPPVFSIWFPSIRR